MSCNWYRAPLTSWSRSLLALSLLTSTVGVACNSEEEPLTAARSQFEVAEEPEESNDLTTELSSDSTRDSGDESPIAESPTLSELNEKVPEVERPITPPEPNRQRNGSGAQATSGGQRGTTRASGQTAGRTQQENSTADVTAEQRSAQLAPPVVSQESLESLTPPQGPPEAIWQFIEQLDERRPRGRTDRDIVNDIQRILAARIQAAEMILQNAEAPAELRRKCVDVKLTSLQGLVQMGIPEARDHLLAFAQGLRRDKDPEISGMGRLLSFTMLVNRVVEGQVGDAEPIISAAQQLLKEEPDNEPDQQLLTQVASAAITIMDAGFMEEGKQLVDIINQKYSGTGQRGIDDILGQLADETHYQELQLSKKLQEFAEGKEEALEPLLSGTREYLDRENPGFARLQRAQFIGEALERKQHVDAAKDVYQQIDVAFQNVNDQQLAQAVEETTSFANRRMSLLNHPLAVTGTLQDGTDLNWTDYQGKVVLITFWAASNFQYLQPEIQAFQGLLETYRDRGFAVVSINVDEDRELVTGFLKYQSLPWPTVLDGSAGNRQMMEKCGVSSVPFNLLLDQNGTVVELHCNSVTLRDRLASLLGSPDTAPPDGKEEPARQTGSYPVDRDIRSYFVSYTGPEEDPTSEPKSEDPPTEEAQEENANAQPQPAAEPAEVNPYLAPGNLGRAELAEFLLKMQGKPKSIRQRPGFDEALLDAAERILQSGEDDNFRTLALQTKLHTLHRRAVMELEAAEEQLWSTVEGLRDNVPQSLAQEIEMLTLEHELLAVDALPIEQVPELLDRAHAWFSQAKLDERHLRIASATVHAINRLDVEQREGHFQRFGQLFGTSSDRRLAAYGRRIAATEAAPNMNLVGQELELSGATALGVEFDWAAYRGKVVLVDFWATWCGPCRTEMPLVKALWEKNRARGFEVVGVNLDQNLEQLGKYLEQQALPWDNVIGDGARDVAMRYEIEAIPTLALIDREGKVVAVSHSSTELIGKIEELLQ